MFRTFFQLSALLYSCMTFASSPNLTDTVPFTFENSTSYEINSKILNRTYTIYVSVPRGYSASSDKKYPMILMNDGPYAFPTAVGALSVPMNSGKFEQVILVGIGYSKGDNMMLSRVRDYSPSVDQNFKRFQPGQAAQYLEFLEKELIPSIESKYLVNSNRRTLVGHSAGGLFGSYVLVNKPDLFESYIILSAALFWDNKLLFKQEKVFASNNDSLNARVYFAVGSTEQPPASPFNWVAIQESFINQVVQSNYSGLELKGEVIEGALHETSYPLGFLRGAQWLYTKK